MIHEYPQLQIAEEEKNHLIEDISRPVSSASDLQAYSAASHLATEVLQHQVIQVDTISPLFFQTEECAPPNFTK
jgi:hypothetical protein